MIPSSQMSAKKITQTFDNTRVFVTFGRWTLLGSLVYYTRDPRNLTLYELSKKLFIENQIMCWLDFVNGMLHDILVRNILVTIMT